MPTLEDDMCNQVKGLQETVLILDLHNQGLSLSALARKVGCDRKTVCKYLARGMDGIAKLLAVDCAVLEKTGLCYHFDGVIGPEAECAVAGMAI